MTRGYRATRVPLAAVLTAGTLTGLLVLAVAAPAAQADDPPGDVGEPTAEQLEQAVRSFDPGAGVRTFTAQVVPLAQVATAGEQTTLTLAADILFAPDRWDLAPAARERITELVADAPEGAEVTISGHTDSVVGAVDNQELSERRAEAVAAVIEEARGDLQLEVTGFADTRPTVTEDPEDPTTFAANRRVEIGYTG